MAAVRGTLYGRLLRGYVVIVLATWALAVGALLWTAMRDGDASMRRGAETIAQRTLVALRPLLDRPGSLQQAAAALEAIERGRLTGDWGVDADALRIEVRVDGQLVHGTPGGGSPAPAARTGTIAVTAAVGDALQVTALVPTVRSLVLRTASIGWLLLPLVVSLPLMVPPAAWATRRALAPLRRLRDEIEARGDRGFAPLATATVGELVPIVEAINRLLGRLSDRHAREQAFIADTVHALKTPLAAIRLDVERCRDDDASVRDDAVARIGAGVARADRSVAQLLALARVQAGADAAGADATPPSADLAELVRRCVAQSVGVATAAGVELEVDAPDACRLAVDPDGVALLVDNLLDNAIRHSPVHGRVRVRIRREDDAVVLEVTDEGPGIPPDARGRVFERFVRVPGDDTPGSGLGLSIVRAAAERNRAAVTLGDGPGARGLRVVVRFAG